MNTSHKNDTDFTDLFKFDGKEKGYSHDSYILQSGFLSEIELVQKQQNVSRKDLAKKIGISASYLTQVFRNDKPLNFYTLAKIKKALNIRFSIRAVALDEGFSLSGSSYALASNYEIKEMITNSNNIWALSATNVSSSPVLIIEKS